MKPTVISAEALFEEHREALQWEWIAGHAHPERRFDEAAVRNAQSAADLVNTLDADDLARILWQYGEESRSRVWRRFCSAFRRPTPCRPSCS